MIHYCRYCSHCIGGDGGIGYCEEKNEMVKKNKCQKCLYRI